MTAPDLAAIRERNEGRKSGSCYDCGHAHDGSDARADIDALLAEVERLRHKASECECSYRTPRCQGPRVVDICWSPGRVCDYMRRVAAQRDTGTGGTS